MRSHRIQVAAASRGLVFGVCVLALWVFPLPAPAQWLSVGVTGGVPISPHSMNEPAVVVETIPPVSGPNDLYMKPYAVGPSVEVNLPWNISVDSGMLYERFHEDITQGLTAGHGNPVNFGFRADVAANAWLFPLLLKYNFEDRRIRPFVDAGATLRHLDEFTGQGISRDFYSHAQPVTFQFQPDRAVYVAFTAGAGLRYQRFGIDFSPEIRYLHWTTLASQPVRDQAMLMLGITFPARR